MRNHAVLTIGLLLLAAPGMAPAQDVPISQVLIDGQSWELVGEGYKFTEAPAADGKGNVYFADVGDNKIYRVAESGPPVVFVADSKGTSGLMFGPGGKLYGCQSGGRRIVTYDDQGAATVLADDVDCNDLVVDGKGNVYFTDPKHKQIWHVDPQGKKRVVDEGIEFPNGIALWPDAQTLVVADMRGPHMIAFRVETDGSLAFKQPYYPAYLLPGQTGSGADGMKVDSQGRLYVATFAGLQMFDTQGRLSAVIAKPQEKFLSNVAFGGPELDTLYVTCTDKVYRRKVKVKGVRYP